jgi:predicted secreted acid phosphatase
MNNLEPAAVIRPLADDETAQLLAEVLDRARQGGANAIVVFDLDSTLLDNRPRQARIMREYGAEVGLAALAAHQSDHWQGWDAKIAMRNSGLTDAQIEAHHAPFRQYWWERFFTSEYCVDDRLIAGAERYAGAVAGTGATLCYVTGRHELMRRGTLENFGALGLPLPGERVDLLMKPTLDEHDDAYKLRTYDILRGRGDVIAAFDNEPSHINGYRAAFPDALSVHLATDDSMRGIPVSPGIPSIRSFATYR